MHGADAIGGVVNIVLRKNVPEPRLDVDYGAAEGGSVERHAAFSASGIARPRVGARSCSTTSIAARCSGRERDRWNNQDFTRFGSIDWRSPTASPGNVSSTTLGESARSVIEFRGDTARWLRRDADAGGLHADRRAAESRKSLSDTTESATRSRARVQSRKANTS